MTGFTFLCRRKSTLTGSALTAFPVGGFPEIGINQLCNPLVQH